MDAFDRLTLETLGPFLDRINDPACAINRGMRVIAVNRPFLARHNSTAKQILGKRCHKVFHANESVCTNCPTIQAFEGNKVVRTEQRGKDGRLYEVVSRPLKFWDNDRKKRVILETSRDITDRHNLLKSFTDYGDQYTYFLNQINEAVFLFGRLGQLTYANSAAESLMGEPLDSLTGRKLTDFFPRESAKKAQRILLNTLGGKSVSGALLEMSTALGVRHLMISTSPTIRDDEVIGAIVLVSDVSHEAQAVKKVVSRVERLTHRLKESEEAHRRLFYLVPEAIVLASLSGGEILDVNENFFGLFECEWDDLSGKTIQELFVEPREGEINGYTPFPVILAALKKGVGMGLKEMRCRTFSARSFPALISFATAHYADSDYIIAVIRDISEEKMIREELKNRSKYLYDLVLELAHNLRNPITVIGGFARRATRNSGHLSENELSIILKELLRLEGLIHFVQSFSSLLNTEFRPARVSPGKLFDAVLSKADHKGSPIGPASGWQVEKGCPDILGDFAHLELLLSHLITDETAAFDPQEAVREVLFKAGAQEDSGMVKITVEIRRSELVVQQSLDFPDAGDFRRPTQGEMRHALPRLIVKRHRGSLSVESPPDGSQRIVVLLPAVS